MRWVGIDEAGYGPNLGPLVMAAVVVESCEPSGSCPPGLDPPTTLWDDLALSVCRARGPADRFAVDDSKAILKGAKGRTALYSTCLALLDAAGRPLPDSTASLISEAALDASSVELDRWRLTDEPPPPWPKPGLIEGLRARLASRPFAPPSNAWRISEVYVEVVGPERFNAALERFPSKAAVHFKAFARLLDEVWGLAADGRPTHVLGDKHGGRHYYLEPLASAFPETWIDRGEEGPELSSYTIRSPGRSLNLRLTPRADAHDALVALASITAKTIRECWMDVFNGYWAQLVPGLRPSAGYPVDASRFRRDIEPTAASLGIGPRLWWRER